MHDILFADVLEGESEASVFPLNYSHLPERTFPYDSQ
jgi:hypothetical protein